ncbi:unnamed protein product [Prunus armeniaca]
MGERLKGSCCTRGIEGLGELLEKWQLLVPLLGGGEISFVVQVVVLLDLGILHGLPLIWGLGH